ncbi:Pediocin PA-1 transport/processing ATP-binding protein pedD [Nosema bombycis CQ1]|uniref:Pediocin PA-1 transport/processing ATP-binding protein pedD n=1 Tax=Nosema bombycis (strain CQ1 / CVCC 102059) TaxID=578461 RepID=R0MH04_NOSB1|nr:Pediocin PA-1 transport/processing ATP-binding protein pedD [Nosema bombycis CQ1]|eukprot:EOB13385.1 Pediocin PA-1 transport/processing ATP-binding protein pedD [Nosema bombycis CQ1]
MRALLNKKKIFVLDEPTSALDKDSELKVINSLLFKEETTVIMILQNLELINKFDKILLIENNKIETIENIGDLNDPQESKTH